MKNLGAAFLFLLALFSGGCSLYFTGTMFYAMSDEPELGHVVLWLWLGGIVVAVISIWSGRNLLRENDPRLDKTGVAPPPSDDPPPPTSPGK